MSSCPADSRSPLAASPYRSAPCLCPPRCWHTRQDEQDVLARLGRVLGALAVIVLVHVAIAVVFAVIVPALVLACLALIVWEIGWTLRVSCREICCVELREDGTLRVRTLGRGSLQTSEPVVGWTRCRCCRGGSLRFEVFVLRLVGGRTIRLGTPGAPPSHVDGWLRREAIDELLSSAGCGTTPGWPGAPRATPVSAGLARSVTPERPRAMRPHGHELVGARRLS